MDKKDEEELKEWKEKNLNYVETYGVDIYKNGDKKKNVERTINNINRVIKVILIIFAIAIVIFTVAILVYRWKVVHDLVNNNVDPFEKIYDELKF